MKKSIIMSIAGAFLVLAGFVATDRGRVASEPLDECVEYAATMRRCFGARHAMVAAPPPKDAALREAARRQCTADRARLEKACR